MTKVIHFTFWTPEMNEFLKANYKSFSKNELTEMFEKKYPKSFKWARCHIASRMENMGLTRYVDRSQLPGEVWKSIPGYELYEASNMGRIRNKNGKILKACKHITGYFQLSLFKGSNGKLRQTEKVHRLQAYAFIPNPENKPFINHKNGIKDDNRLENLEWCTPSENSIHAYKAGLMKSQAGSLNGHSKLNESQVKRIWKLLKKGEYHYLIAKKFGVSRSIIQRIHTGTAWHQVTGLERKVHQSELNYLERRKRKQLISTPNIEK